MKTTDMDYVKDVAKTLLYLDVQETEIDFILVHPFLSQRDMVLNNTDHEVLDILASPENLDKARKRFTELIEGSDDLWHIMFLMHKPYRPLLFKLCDNKLSKEDFAKALEYVWTGTENPNQDPNVSISQWIKYFKKADKSLLMDEDDFAFYNSLSDNDPITIFRGVGKDREPYGLSWTVSIKTAKWFAKRWKNTEAYMFKTQCYKKDVLAYFNTRGEDELVVNVKALDKNNVERIELV